MSFLELLVRSFREDAHDHSTFIQNLCDVAPRSEAPVPPIQLDAPALVIQWLLTAVRRPDILHWCRIFREGIVPYEVPQGEYWIEVATTIQVYRLADYLGCEKVMSKMTEFWERFDCDTLLALLRAASTINDLEIGRTIIAMSETVFGRVYDELVSYAADHWEEVVGKLSPDWQLRLFHAFWRPSRQYLNRPECDTPRRPDGRRRNRPHEFIWIEARRTPQEIADLFLPQEHLKGGFDPPDECKYEGRLMYLRSCSEHQGRPGSSEDRPRSDGRVE